MFLWFLCLLTVLGQTSSNAPVTTVAQGQLRGRWFTTRGGRNVTGFLGIPYAAPPTGPLRFKSPQPAEPWEGVYSATEDAPGCIQKVGPPLVPLRPTNISEDCLYLNVYSPDLKPCKRFSVLVFIYGGGFETGGGFSSAYGPDYFLDEDIILVTLNYRPGILGFLSLEHPVLPGNLGLKDQRAALRWVRDNISQFGGDPRKVTIFGESAGAISIHFHLIFTAKEGLFRAGIANSGSAQSLFGFQRPGSQRPVVDRLIRKTNCPSDPVELVECLRQLPAYEFENIRADLQKTSNEVKRHVPVFTPMIEPDCVEDALITTDPWNTTISFPLLQGANQMEGLFRTVDFEVDQTDNKFKLLNADYRDIIPYNFFIENSAKNPSEVAEMLKQFYFGKENIDREHYLKLVDISSDGYYNYPLRVATRKNKGKTYFYQLNYKGSNSQVHYLGSDSYCGVSHVDDLFYLFPCGGPGRRNITESDTKISKQMVKMWTNFAKYLNPTPFGCPTRWRPVNTSSIEFLNIGQFNYTMDSNFLKPRMDFWDQLPFRNKQQEGRPRC